MEVCQEWLHFRNLVVASKDSRKKISAFVLVGGLRSPLIRHSGIEGFVVKDSHVSVLLKHISSGANTKFSAFLHGLINLTGMYCFPFWIRRKRKYVISGSFLASWFRASPLYSMISFLSLVIFFFICFSRRFTLFTSEKCGSKQMYIAYSQSSKWNLDLWAVLYEKFNFVLSMLQSFPF